MIRKFVLATALAVVATMSFAFDVENMSDAERAAFRAEIRAYLLDHPEVIFEAVDVYDSRKAAAQAGDDIAMIQANASAILDDGHSWVGGNPEGDITVVEFLDYRCAYCRKAFKEVHELIATDGNIRYIIKEFPILGEQSTLASRFAIAVRNTAGAEAYEKTHAQLMAMRASVSRDTLSRVAGALGLDMDVIETAMNSDAVENEIRANHALGQQLQITGTPSFVFQSEMLRGYAPLDAMRAIVARQRGG